MRHENSVFHQLLKHIPWAVFDRLVDEHRADHRVRRLSTKDQFIALLYAQLSGAASLREMTGNLSSHSARLYHLGSRPVSRSTLSDANASRPSAVFSGLFAHLAAKACRGLRQKVAEAVHLIDSTGIRLSGMGSDWAHFSHKACGAKAHIIYDAQAGCPAYFQVTAATVNDITAAKAMPIKAGATYVFDLGYYDFNWWAKLDKAGCRIVTRLKKNTALKDVTLRELPQGSNILSDRIGFLPKRTLHGANTLTDAVREVCVRTDTGKELRILSNDLDASAQEIADLYRQRWAIELFFKWVKQTLRIRHCLGRSENAIRIQIAVALIAYLLIQLAHACQKAIQNRLAFTRTIRTNLMHRRPIDQLIQRNEITKNQQSQLVLI